METVTASFFSIFISREVLSTAIKTVPIATNTIVIAQKNNQIMLP